MFMWAGIVSAQIGSNPSNFNNGIKTKLVQPDTLSTIDRDALTPKLGTILYHKDTGVSRWEQWDGTNWIEFGGDTSGFVTLGTDQTITGLKTFDNDVIADNLYIGTSSPISGSKLHVNKVSSDGSTSVVSFISNENTLSGSSSNITYGTINRTFFSGSGTTGEIWGTQSIGRNSGSGTSGTLIGSNSLAELSGTGTSSNLYGSFSNTKINGSGSSTTTTALGGWDRVEINNPLSSVENIYGTYSNVDLIGGAVTNQAVANFLDFDFVTGDAADVSVNNLYYIKANADNLPTVTGEAYFIKSEVDLPSSFAGSVTAPEFTSSVSTGTAPLTVASTTKVDNLNADLLRGVHWGNVNTNIVTTGIVNINNGTDITPNSSGDGQLKIGGNAYGGYIALDATGMHIGNNSSARTVTLDVNETTRLSINNAGTLTVTGSGEFGGTVSGSDPVNSDDFVTKGYGESNFGSPMTVIDRVLAQSTVTTVGTDITLYDFNNAALQLASDGDFFEFKFMFTYSGSTSNTLRPTFQYGGTVTSFSTESNVVSGNFSVEGYALRKTDDSVSVYFTTRLAPSGFEYSTVIDNATTQSRLRIGYTASAATSITLKTGYIKKYTF